VCREKSRFRNTEWDSSRRAYGSSPRRATKYWIESGAGGGIGVTDAHYESVGAQIAPTAAAVFERSELIVKVKEPQPIECAMLRSGQVLFTYLHLAADPAQAEALMRSGATAIAYETVTARNGFVAALDADE